MKPNVTQTAQLRSRPHNTKLYLSIYEPNTVLSATVTTGSSVERGDIAIPFTEVSGDPLLVEPGMTMYVGTLSNSSNRGKLRVRGITGSTVYVSENEVSWEDGQYLTVINFFEINAIYPRIIQDPEDALNVIFYKDWDIEYTDQNEVLGSFICMGPNSALWKDESLYYSASGTYNLLGEGLTYDWHFQGGNPTGSSSHTPGYVTYDTPGHYTTRLTVSTTGSAVDTSYRHVSVYDKPGEGDNLPVLKWTLEDLSGDRSNGGYTSRIKIHENVNIRDGSLIVIFADDRYGTSDVSIGGNALNRSKIVFVGYVIQGTIEYNWQFGHTEFLVGSPTEIMKLAETFAVSVESVVAPTTWYQLLDMDTRRAIYHYLKWHSTILLTTDFEFRGDDYAIQFFDADRTSLYDAIKSLMDSTLVGNLVSDRQGKLFAEVDISVTNNTSGTFQTAWNLEKQDWMGSPIIQERLTPDLSFLEMGGIAYDGPALNTFAALLSNAPGYTPGYRGKVERKQGLALQDQDQLNSLVGNIFGFRNSIFPDISYEIVGNYRNFDIAPQEIITTNLAASDTPRNIVLNGTPFTNRGMNWRYDPVGEVFIPILSLALVTSPGYADTITYPTDGGSGGNPPMGDPGFGLPIIIPPEPPDDGDDGGGFALPPIQVPPFPTPTPIGTGGGGAVSAIGLVASTKTVTFTGFNTWVSGGSVSFTSVLYNTGPFLYSAPIVTILTAGTYWVHAWWNAFGGVTPELGADWRVTADVELGIALSVGVGGSPSHRRTANWTTLVSSVGNYNSSANGINGLANVSIGVPISVTAGTGVSVSVAIFADINNFTLTPTIFGPVSLEISSR